MDLVDQMSLVRHCQSLPRTSSRLDRQDGKIVSNVDHSSDKGHKDRLTHFIFVQLKNLSFFTILIALVMTAYGVASRSMAFHGSFTFSVGNVFQFILYPVYYLLYTNLSGELKQLDGKELEQRVVRCANDSLI